MRLLDLFCGAGGSAEGYRRAGFTEIVGVDIVAQPNYPFEFFQGDALAYLDRLFSTGNAVPGFDAVHASPPCQGYVGWQNITEARGGNRWKHPLLIDPVRVSLKRIGLPYVIENVENAGTYMRNPIRLCGSQFGLGVRRHRLFESENLLMQPKGCQHSGNEIGVYGKLDGRRLFTRVDGSELRNPSSLEQAQDAMGIDWMTWDELKEAIPPAYTEYVGRQLLDQMARVA